MKIFISGDIDAHRYFYEELVSYLRQSKHQAYPIQLKGFFGASGLHDPDELDEYLREVDLAIAAISKESLEDRWLRGELHALFTLEHKIRPGFVLPIFMEGIDNDSIPEECFIKPYVDFRGRPIRDGFLDLTRQVNELASKPRLAVFVSHSRKDEKIAEALSELVKSAFNLRSEEVLCTSVGGHGLPLSTHVSDALRRKIREAKVFVCIGTENSIGTRDHPGSFYVAVELGARWGMRRYLAIMLASGMTGSMLSSPFSEVNVLSCEDSGQVQQFIREITPRLGRDPESADRYSRKIDDLVAASR